MKKLITFLFFLSALNLMSQVEIVKDSTTLTFKNQKELNKEKLPIFINRLELYYDIDISYDELNNIFLLQFKNIIKEEELDSILSHFNINEYIIVKYENN